MTVTCDVQPANICDLRPETCNIDIDSGRPRPAPAASSRPQRLTTAYYMLAVTPAIRLAARPPPPPTAATGLKHLDIRAYTKLYVSHSAQLVPN